MYLHCIYYHLCLYYLKNVRELPLTSAEMTASTNILFYTDIVTYDPGKIPKVLIKSGVSQ